MYLEPNDGIYTVEEELHYCFYLLYSNNLSCSINNCNTVTNCCS